MPVPGSRNLTAALSGRPSRRRTRMMNWSNATPSTSGTWCTQRPHMSAEPEAEAGSDRAHHCLANLRSWPELTEKDELDDALICRARVLSARACHFGGAWQLAPVPRLAGVVSGPQGQAVVGRRAIPGSAFVVGNGVNGVT